MTVRRSKRKNYMHCSTIFLCFKTLARTTGSTSILACLDDAATELLHGKVLQIAIIVLDAVQELVRDLTPLYVVHMAIILVVSL